MMIKSCLIIDDVDQSEEIEKLKRDAMQNGINLDCHQFNVGDTSKPEFLTDNKIDIRKVISELHKNFGKRQFDIVAFDWELDDEDITGIELIRQFNHHKILLQSPKIVYSGKLDIILKGIIRDNTLDNAVKRIKSLVRSQIYEFIDRDDRDSSILEFLSKNIKSNELIIIQLLRDFPDLRFGNNFTNQNFNGKTYCEIADLFDENPKQHLDFKTEIIEQVIAYLTEKII